MLDDDSTREQRQYCLIGEVINEFTSGRVELPTLVQKLKGLLAVIEAFDPSWVAEFRRAWGTLEIKIAVAFNQKEENLIPDIETFLRQPSNQDDISNAIQRMRQLLDTRIKGAT